MLNELVSSYLGVSVAIAFCLCAGGMWLAIYLDNKFIKPDRDSNQPPPVDYGSSPPQGRWWEFVVVAIFVFGSIWFVFSLGGR